MKFTKKFTKALLKTKMKATGVHLLMSLVVFAYMAYLIVYVWYPEPYFSIDGGWQGIRLVAAVDLVLGPLITFLIFDLSKRRTEIILDLLVIVTIQFGALAYGVYTTYNQRPIAIVMIDDFVVPATMEYYGGKLNSTDELHKYSDEHPPIIFADIPFNREGLNEVTRIRNEEKVLELAQMQLYQPKSKLKDALKERQLRFFERLDVVAGRGRYDNWLQLNQKKNEQILIAPFMGRYGNVWLVFDLEGKYLSYF